MKELTKDMVDFDIELQEEYDSIEISLSKEVTGADHSEYIKKVLNDEGFNPWLWCCVKVTATFGDLYGEAYLGHCAYENEADFKKGGYYEQMKDEAFHELKSKIDWIVNQLK